MTLENVLRMNAGDGEASYAKNSGVQEALLLKSRKVVEDCINKYGINGFPQCFKLADLGCSSGPNTLLPVKTIIDTVHATCQRKGLDVPEFQVFLNDLPENDFNTTFRMVQPFYSRLADEKGDKFKDKCFISGVPGSFYTRLFPSGSLDFVHSSSSVHWLSQVPEKVESNKGHINIADESPPGICQAYLNQYTRDFSTFLHLRSDEITTKGCMVLAFQGSSADPSKSGSCRLFELLAKSLLDMSSEGFLSEAEIDSFNFPFYNPTVDEVKVIIEREGSFSLESLQTIERRIEIQSSTNKDSMGEMVAKRIRAVNEPMLIAHFGDTFMDKLFERYAERVAEHISKENLEFLDLIISLTRKSY
ncbi:SABATH methyltransferase 22 [Heracleum sosnowskyi]|uniref:SABATH methyltransferase 22 n=1 Tax=Heracleum sosnowskyi TaxID=360622 RepID=A0AAD8J0F3_9APIA|nr:SABATH methyltransferase 22 [Heracleum sosnowskyi]